MKSKVKLFFGMDPKRLFRKPSKIELGVGLMTAEKITTKFVPLTDPTLIGEFKYILERIAEAGHTNVLDGLAQNPLLSDRFDPLFKACCPEFSGDYIKSVLPAFEGEAEDIGCWNDLNPVAKANFLQRFFDTEAGKFVL